MATNLDKYNADLDSLLSKGTNLLNAIQAECYPEEFQAQAEKKLGSKPKAKAFIASMPTFNTDYQTWYSEARAVIKQLLPDRLADFIGHYEKPKNRKELTYTTYRIEDALRGLRATRGGDVVVDRDAAISHMTQQFEILRSAKARFKSSLFDQLVMADLLDSELDAAKELAKKKFLRAAGAIAGVVLEKHLRQVCDNHDVKVTKADPGISHLNDLLKSAEVIETPQWRNIQYLGDLRNMCDHAKGVEPTPAQIAHRR